MRKTFTLLLLIPLFSLSVHSQDLTEVFPGFIDMAWGALAWGDIDGDGEPDLISQGLDNSEFSRTYVYINLGEGNFESVENHGIPDFSNGQFAFADYDNDGDDDLIVLGSPEILGQHTGLYICNGDGTFTWSGQDIGDHTYLGSCNWVDYDNDGDLDIFISGFHDVDDADYYSKLYKNNNGIFTHVENLNLPKVSYSSSDWADFDGDGYQDLYIQGLGWTPQPDAAAIYKNNGDDSFSLYESYDGLWLGDAQWIDYDQDGDPDLIYTGFNTLSGNRVTHMLKNDNGVFNEITTPFINVSQTGLDWADYDLDGKPDLFIVGAEELGVNHPAHIYHNDGGDSFTQSDFEFTGGWFCDAAWEDYDMDGDPDLFYMAEDLSGTKHLFSFRNDIIIGIKELNAGDIKLYPNPASDYLMLSVFNRNFERIEIMDVSGKVLWNTSDFNSIKIDISFLNDGVYFLRLETGGNIITKKFIKQ